MSLPNVGAEQRATLSERGQSPLVQSILSEENEQCPLSESLPIEGEYDVADARADAAEARDLAGVGLEFCNRAQADKAAYVRRCAEEIAGKERAKALLRRYQNTVVMHEDGGYRRALMAGQHRGLRRAHS